LVNESLEKRHSRFFWGDSLKGWNLFRVPGERFIVSSRNTDFSSESKQTTTPVGKRSQRQHVDSMWPGYTFQFRIRGVGKVYVTGFTDDCSRYRVKSKVYLYKDAASAVNALQWALRAGRTPREIYLDCLKSIQS